MALYDVAFTAIVKMFGKRRHVTPFVVWRIVMAI